MIEHERSEGKTSSVFPYFLNTHPLPKCFANHNPCMNFSTNVTGWLTGWQLSIWISKLFSFDYSSVLQENVEISTGNYETRSFRLVDKNVECWVVFESSYKYYALQLLAARLPELASKLERLDCFHWFYSEHRRGYQSKLYSSGERWYKIVVCFFFAEMTKGCY